jgi:spore coat protein H
MAECPWVRRAFRSSARSLSKLVPVVMALLVACSGDDFQGGGGEAGQAGESATGAGATGGSAGRPPVMNEGGEAGDDNPSRGGSAGTGGSSAGAGQSGASGGSATGGTSPSGGTSGNAAAGSGTSGSSGAGSGGTTAGSSGTAGTAGTPDTAGQIFFQQDRLHVVDITVEATHLDQLDTDLDNRVPCTITYDGETIANAGIRKKGQSTLQPLAEKPSFSVKLDEFEQGADIDGVQKFQLNNSVKDDSYLAEPVAYLTYLRAGVPAPRTALAVVRFNGETKGIYVVVEGVNKRFLRHAYGDGNGNLYEGPWDFTADVADADLKDIEDGRTREDLQAFSDAVMGASDEQLLAAIEPHLDIDEMYTTIAIEMALCLWDGYTIAAWNFYFYHVPGGRFVMLPHGADWPYYVDNVDPFNPDFRPWGDGSPPGLLAVRMVDADRARYTLALERVRDDAFDLDVLNDLIDTLEDVVHSADTSDPVLASAVSAFDAEVSTPREFLASRRAFLSTAF